MPEDQVENPCTASRHCGAVKFECHLDLAAGTRRCSCGSCWKSRIWKAFAMQGDSRRPQGEAALSGHQASPSQWPKGDVHRYLCTHRGIRPFSKGYLEEAPSHGTFHAVNVAALDTTDPALCDAPIQYEDGRANRWDAAPRATSRL